MLKKKYQILVKSILSRHLNKSAKFFIFGSSVKTNDFRDIDIGVKGVKDETRLVHAREDLEESQLPYRVDVIDFSNVDRNFEQKVFNGKILWLN
ncbi:hypothetical protein HYW82_02120 [Candidatus Peregrinibacteria bacterium]|nr:hypothetical protein [Candidatus Peregrinibacteria bacterium]